MTKEVTKKQKKSAKEIEIDVTNDDLMVSIGIRLPKLTSRDQSVWTKTPNEKRILRNVRSSSKGLSGHFNVIPEKNIPVRGKLIIYLKKNTKYPKTTYSIECWQHEIAGIIGNYRALNKQSKLNENVVLKYTWNGQTYAVGTLPFWK